MNVGNLVTEAQARSRGRYGRDLPSVIWPTREVRFVAAQEFHPFTGDSMIAVKAAGPEIAPRRASEKLLVPLPKQLDPYMVEVHFEKRDHFYAEIFANKCLIVLSSLVVEGKTMTREQFYQAVKMLFDNDFQKGVAKPGKRVTKTKEVFVEDKTIPRKSF